MTFSTEEIVAVTRLVNVMIMADGSADKREVGTLSHELARLGVGPEQQPGVLDTALALRPVDAVARVARMDQERKRYVSAFLANAMISNGEIHDAELVQWRQLTHLCELPEMSIEQALSYLIKLGE
ncbi:MAG: hypothetical protein CSA07_03005 [Bacteroidia bacterium]|nr:MAG: hypothetical protein CSA07_03005 [Bacteroidia bacterium]